MPGKGWLRTEDNPIKMGLHKLQAKLEQLFLAELHGVL